MMVQFSTRYYEDMSFSTRCYEGISFSIRCCEGMSFSTKCYEVISFSIRCYIKIAKLHFKHACSKSGSHLSFPKRKVPQRLSVDPKWKRVCAFCIQLGDAVFSRSLIVSSIILLISCNNFSLAAKVCCFSMAPKKRSCNTRANSKFNRI